MNTFSILRENLNHEREISLKLLFPIIIRKNMVKKIHAIKFSFFFPTSEFIIAKIFTEILFWNYQTKTVSGHED